MDRGEMSVIATIDGGAEAVRDKLAYFRCKEVLVEPVRARTLVFKVERYLKALSAIPREAGSSEPNPAAQRKHSGIRGIQMKEEAEASEKEVVESKVPTLAEAQPKVAKTPVVRMVNPLSIESDCWILQGGGARTVGGRWSLKLKGPGPSAGRWAECERPKEIQKDGAAWSWCPTDPDKDPFIGEQGEWIFVGGKAPEFLDDLWWFTGTSPSLGFYFEGECLGFKFREGASSSEILLARDSSSALAALPAIEASWLRVVRSQQPAATSASGDPAAQGDRSELSQSGGGDPGGYSVRMGAPLHLDSDFWIYQKGRVKRIADRWVVRLKGPGSTAGRWTQIDLEDLPKDLPKDVLLLLEKRFRDPHWRWEPIDAETDPFLKEDGSWVFRGFAPKFDADAWVFISRNPELAFFYRGESYGEKIATVGDRAIQIARNSAAAARALPLIERSLITVISDHLIEKDAKDHEWARIQKRRTARAAEAEQSASAVEKASRGDGERYWEPRADRGRNQTTEEDDGDSEPKRTGKKPKRTEEEPSQSSARERRKKRKAAAEPGETGGKKYWEVRAERAAEELSQPGEVSAARDRSSKSVEPEGTHKKKRKGPRAKDSGLQRRSRKKDSSNRPVDLGVTRLRFEKEKERELRDLRSQDKDEGPRQFWISVGVFGTGGGGWECVGAEGESTGKRYVFVSAEIESGSLARVEDGAPFWTYLGVQKPSITQDRKEFVFRDRRPERLQTFADLATPIQTHLRGRIPAQRVIRSHLGETSRTFAKAIRKRVELKGDSVPGAIAAVSAVELAMRPTGTRLGGAESQGAPTRLRDFAASVPPGPTLGPLAIAFLVSEVLSSRRLPVREMVRRTCIYLSASCGGLHVEIWRLEEGKWNCLGASDGSPGRLGSSIEEGEKFRQGPADRAYWARDSRCRLAWVWYGESAQPFGAVLLAGEGAELVTENYAAAVATMTTGLLRKVA